MIEMSRGKLIVNAIPNLEVEQKVSAFLATRFNNTNTEKVAALVRKAPVVLVKNISERAARRLVANMEALGASASFVPDKSSSGRKGAKPSQPIPAESADPPGEGAPPGSIPRVDPVNWRVKLFRQIEEANKELWLIVSMFFILAAMNYLVTGQRVLLGFYALPTLFSAYHYGRRHATLTALASLLLVVLAVHFNPQLLAENTTRLQWERWLDVGAWGAILMITAYAMGTLYERNENKMKELRRTYRGLIVILRHFISKDKYTENHCYRVSLYAARIAVHLGFNSARIEDIRSAGMLHDIGKLDISRELLYKAANLSQEEFKDMKKHVDKGVELLDSVSSPLGRIVPIILAHHERYDGSGYMAFQEEEIPMESRVLAVADVYDALVSDRPYRKAMSPFEAKEIIVNGSGSDFDPRVVEAFLKAFRKGEMDVPNVMV